MLSSFSKSVACLTLAIAILCSASSAFAQKGQPEIPQPLRAAPDDLSGHFIIAPKVAYLIPMGSAEQRLSLRGFIESGPSVGVDLAFGVSRYVALQGRFDYGQFGRGNDCPAGEKCEATSMAFGAGIDYHLVNGAAFDPWMRAGLGYRIMRYDLTQSGVQTELQYSGIEWLHLAVGGDWFPHSMIGFGPYFAFDIGTYSNRPKEDVPRAAGTSEGAIHTFFSVGLRGVFDPMR